ncbi:MAG: hypothetical protein SFX18_10125 [Pirellulales bacterium]|nr:hypothetical protein [Pirellulales bacterium]
MLTSVEGIFRNGKIELLQKPDNVQESRVIVTFLDPETILEPAESRPGPIDLSSMGVDAAQAAELRYGFGAAAVDWDQPEMDCYNDL